VALAAMLFGLVAHLGRLWAGQARTKAIAEALREAMARGTTPPPELLDALKSETERWRHHHHHGHRDGGHHHNSAPHRALLFGALTLAFGVLHFVSETRAEAFGVIAIVFGFMTAAFIIEMLYLKRRPQA
jgi:Flp pilus assembly protein TadB